MSGRASSRARKWWRAAVLVALVSATGPASAAADRDWRPSLIGGDQDAIFRFPQAVAFDLSGVSDPDPDAPPGPYVYVADQHSFFVQKFTADGRFVRRFGGYGSESGRFGATHASASPTTGTVGGIGGVAVDARGHVLVLDSFNARVERFSAGGEFESEFGTFGSAPGQLNPGMNGGLALLGEELYVADQDNHRVQRFQLDGEDRPVGEPLVFGELGSAPGQLNTPAGLGIDPARDHAVFVADDDNDRVDRFTADGAFETLLGEPGGEPFANPYDAGADLAGRVFVADNQHHRVVRLDAATLEFQTWFGGGPSDQPGKLANVRGIAVAPGADAAGGVFATDTSINQISEFGTDGAFIGAWGRDGRANGAFMQPRDVAVEANGDIVVADTRADRVQVLRTDGTIDSWARVSTTLHRPVSGGGKREFRDPTGVAVDPRNGDVYVVEGGNHRLQRIPQFGDITTTRIWGRTNSAGTPIAGKALGQFTEPLGVDVAPDGTVWVADTRNDRLQRLDPATDTWTALTGFTRPTAIAVLPDGRLAVTELGADPTLPPGAVGTGRLIVLDPDGTRVGTREALDGPEGVEADPDGGILVAETQRDRILSFRLDNGQLMDVGQIGQPGLQKGRFTRPIGLDTAPNGDLVIADTYNNRLQRFEPKSKHEKH